MKQHR